MQPSFSTQLTRPIELSHTPPASPQPKRRKCEADEKVAANCLLLLSCVPQKSAASLSLSKPASVIKPSPSSINSNMYNKPWTFVNTTPCLLTPNILRTLHVLPFQQLQIAISNPYHAGSALSQQHQDQANLALAVMAGQVASVKKFLDKGCVFDPKYFEDAARYGYIGMLQLFIHSKYNIDAGQTPPLIAGILRGINDGKEDSKTIVKLLLDAGANPNVEATGDQFSFISGLRAIDILCTKIASLCPVKSRFFLTADQNRRRKLDIELLQILLQYKPSLTYGNSYTAHPLRKAFIEQDAELAEILLKAGASADEKISIFEGRRSLENVTPLYAAVFQRNIKWIHLLVKYGANKNAVHQFGEKFPTLFSKNEQRSLKSTDMPWNTPLELAARRNCVGGLRNKKLYRNLCSFEPDAKQAL